MFRSARKAAAVCREFRIDLTQNLAKYSTTLSLLFQLLELFTDTQAKTFDVDVASHRSCIKPTSTNSKLSWKLLWMDQIHRLGGRAKTISGFRVVWFRRGVVSLGAALALPETVNTFLLPVPLPLIVKYTFSHNAIASSAPEACWDHTARELVCGCVGGHQRLCRTLYAHSAFPFI